MGKEYRMKRPRVGVGIILIKDNKILLGLRKGELGNGDWGLPGGKLDFGEDPKDCACRELKEETDLVAYPEDLTLAGVSNTVFDDEVHYITILYKATNFYGTVKTMEPDKHYWWSWFGIGEDMPENIFKPLKNFLDGNEIK